MHFDSMETGNTDIGLETMNMISTIDEDEKLQTCMLFMHGCIFILALILFICVPNLSITLERNFEGLNKF